MQLKRIKLTVSALWVLIALVVAFAVNLSPSGRIALAAFGLLPAMAIQLLWNDPPQTMSERIQQALR